jgi:hypothetical protein
MDYSEMWWWTQALSLAMLRAEDAEEKKFYYEWREILFSEMKKLPVKSDKSWRI